MQWSTLKNTLSEVLQISFAIFLASIGLKAFLLPNGFLDGGATGIAILLSKLLDWEMSLILPVVSVPFFVIGFFTITRKILIKSLLAILGLAVMIHFENFQSITEDKLIIATFGGLFLGVGIGLAIRNGAVLDGAEILGLYLNDRLGISIGSIILAFNVVLFGITAVVLTPEIAMYSILAYLVTGKAIDFTIQGFENYVGLMIISKESEQLQHAFCEEIGQGMTVYNGVRGYGKAGINENKEIIHVVINRIDVRRLTNLIKAVDEAAFVIEFDVNNVHGGKVRRYLNTP